MRTSAVDFFHLASDMDVTEIRNRLRQLIAKGALPRTPPSDMWGSTGSGFRCCCICDQPIHKDAPKLEMELSTVVVGMHPTCHTLWMQEALMNGHSR